MCGIRALEKRKVKYNVTQLISYEAKMANQSSIFKSQQIRKSPSQLIKHMQYEQ